MSTDFDSSVMENSTFLREIAEFDIKAPISVTICFEDDNDEIPTTAEIQTKEHQKEAQIIDNSAFVPILEPKKETLIEELDLGTLTDEKHQEEAPRIDNSAFVPILEPKKESLVGIFDPCTLTAESSTSVIVQNNCRDTVHIPDTIQDKVNNNAQGKRKTDDSQLCASPPKKGKHGMDVENNYHIENSLEKLTSYVNKNDGRTDSISIQRNENVVTNFVVSAPEISKPPIAVHPQPQNEIDKINIYITNCLATVSEHMLCIMQSYDLHKRYNTPKETFKDIKNKHFRSVFKLVSTILLPEERNSEFIQTFLKDTVKRAQEASGPGHARRGQDYATLLFEMLTWCRQTKYQMSQIAQNKRDNSVTLTAAEKNSMSGSEHAVKQTQHGNTPCNQTPPWQVTYSNVSTNPGKVCLFSSGPPGRGLSINIDPVKYLQVTGQDLNAEVGNVQQSSAGNNNSITQKTKTADRLTTADESRKELITKIHSNENRITQQPATSSEAPQMPELAATDFLQHPQLASPSANCIRNVPNYNIATQEINARSPLLQKQLAMPQLPLPLGSQQLQPQQQQKSHGVLTHQQAQYNQFRDANTQFGKNLLPPPPPYAQVVHLNHAQEITPRFGPMRQFETQLGQIQQTQPQYNPAQLMQKHNTSMQYHTGQPSSRTHEGNSLVQQPFAQPQLYQQQRPTERFPSEATPPWSHTQQQNEQLKYMNHQNLGSSHLYQTQDKALFTHFHSQNSDDQQVQPKPANQTEWHQELNAIYPVPSQTRKGSPRAASTDSGFISPLNFNISTDQTVLAVPKETESYLPLITHVTSLNEKAAFIDYGNCEVCKKSTKQMCMGCMKVYYCTYQCQSYDWATHASMCMQRSTHHGQLQPS